MLFTSYYPQPTQRIGDCISFHALLFLLGALLFLLGALLFLLGRASCTAMVKIANYSIQKSRAVFYEKAID
jgi:hypothetical protein